MMHVVWALTGVLLAGCSPGEAVVMELPAVVVEIDIDAGVLETPLYEPEPPPKPEKIAYITIDDGPSEQVTPRILDILKEHEVKATFFVLPKCGYEHIFERIIGEGHQMGNHTYSHDYHKLYGGDGQFFREDVLKAEAYLKEKFNYETSLFRFPGGSQSWNQFAIAARREILAELGYRDVDWDISIGDTDPSPAGRDPAAFVANVSGNINEQEKLVILMHDSAGKNATVTALPEIIQTLKEKGYGFDVLGNYFCSSS